MADSRDPSMDLSPNALSGLIPPLGIRSCPIQLPSGQTFQLLVGEDELKGDTPFGVDPLSRYCIRRGRLPSDSLAHLALDLLEPGQVVLDIGAHIGTFSLAMAVAGCHVIAVEPSPRNAALLLASCQRNGLEDRLFLVHAAVSTTPGTLSFLPRGPYGQVVDPSFPDAVRVPSLPIPLLLRRLGIDRVHLIKLDVEGHELQAVQSMRDWSGQGSLPALLYESNHFCHLGQCNRTAHAVKEAVHALGYSWQYRIDVPGRKLIPDLSGEFQPEIVTDYLATQELLAPPPNWRLGRPFTLSDRIRGVLHTALAQPEPWHLSCLGRILKEAPPEIQGHPGVIDLLHRLASHPDESVRLATAWFSGSTQGLAARTTAWAWRTRARADLTLDRHLVRPLQSLVRRLAG